MLKKLLNLSKILLGFDAFCLNKKFLVYNLVNRNLKIKYRRSFLGFFWTILSPLAMSAIYYFIFKVVMKAERPHYLPFILCGVLPWSFFSQSIGEATESIVGNQALISKIPIPIHVFPYVSTLTNFSTLLFALPVILVFSLMSGIPLGWETLLVFYFFICLLIIGYALGTVLAIFFVYLRDLRHAIGLILQIWFYATPIVYDESMLPEKYRWIMYLNPVAPIFNGIHESLLRTGTHITSSICLSTLWTIVTLLVLRITYSKFKNGLAEIL